jgi:hypothetical protein
MWGCGGLARGIPAKHVELEKLISSTHTHTQGGGGAKSLQSFVLKINGGRRHAVRESSDVH